MPSVALICLKMVVCVYRERQQCEKYTYLAGHSRVLYPFFFLGFKSLRSDLFYGMVIGYTENTRYSVCEAILHVSKIHCRLDRTLKTAL